MTETEDANTDPTGTELELPELALIVLVGASGSGKSTFAARHFAHTQVLSSDHCRAMVADDPTDQDATADAFEVLHHIAGKRLAAGRVTVVDATNVHNHARQSLIRLAREHDVLPVAVVLDMPESLCLRRNAERPDAPDPGVVRRQRKDLRHSLRGLRREGFRRVHVLRSESEVDSAEPRWTRLFNNRRADTGPFDVIGDVHGCRVELEALLRELGYRLRHDADGNAVDAEHPAGRRAILLGDLVDRGPDSAGTLRLVMGMAESGNALVIIGNHEHKLVKALDGRKVRISESLRETLDQLDGLGADFRRRARDFCDGLTAHYVLDGGNLVVAHAGLPERYQGRASGRVRAFAMYGDTTGETDEWGLPVRYPWAKDYRGSATVLYGHTPVAEAEWVNNTMCLDTGCVFGGELTALRYPERQTVSVPAERTYSEPVRPMRVGDSAARDGNERHDPAERTPRREPGTLDLGDVSGRRVVHTGHHGRVTIGAEQSAAALEVLSRFAIDPRLLLYLPPTMPPCSTVTEGELLEHPERAFAEYQHQGVRELVCQEKHMGSRAVVLLCRDDRTARERFGVDPRPSGTPGTIHTRTGRAFFDEATSAALLARIHAAVGRTGLWEELDTDWLLLDTELLPWNAKAAGLIDERYAGTATAAESTLRSTLRGLREAERRGVDVAALRARFETRYTDVERFRTAYRSYCHPVDGTEGVRLAPFRLLASEGRAYSETEQEWHLATADRLAAADPGVFRTTRRRTVDIDDAGSVTAATEWWEELTAEGGEGMVVKPRTAALRGRNGLIQPGVKVRGREYLRLVYGPEYTEPHNLERLRKRSLGRKRSLALREHGLGLEALDRLAGGEPLWRLHECVSAVLALESDPVDPRL
ncbi:polynucleotide kinase-phosphatase [Actinopolyspora mzabensis]|uniref:Polynucleotide kinase-phosphatase n=1 Tax=Actinopolyspora mzabensis TaxID=995066 RepID=A0A1G8VR95_ACTMZ|nr:polynucleotide kinase-phosphatase [Actinopolyspora mzabensis]SDJ68413.1 polynucleotide kinase-phosphatase [Actinopolyspora mzabensis]